MKAAATSAAKRNNSLSWKLAWAQVRRIFSIFLKIDLVIILLFALAVLYWGEWQALQISGESNEVIAQIAEASTNLSSTRLEWREKADGLMVPELLGRIGLVAEDSYRAFSVSGNNYHTNFFSSWFIPVLGRYSGDVINYVVFIPAPEGGYYAVSTCLAVPMGFFATGFFFLLLIELFTLFLSIWKAQRSIRRTLRPIYELAATARTIGDTDLSGTIDTLNAITEDDMDRRIHITGEQEELQGLALAINSMLDRLDASYKAQLRFVSDASHELRTPISVIQGYARLLERWGKEDPAILEEAIEAIKGESVGMQVLVEQLLFLARSDNRSIKMNVERVDISSLLEDVLKETQMIDTNHEITGHVEPGMEVLGDQQLLKQGIRILVDNAIKYTPEGGRITIGNAAYDANHLSIQIGDSGTGIAPEELPHLFERFWRADESRARKTGGTGLGLSIAKWVAESHKGFIDVMSRKDFGSRFSIVLPLPPGVKLPVAEIEKEKEKKDANAQTAADQQKIVI